jgi:protein arginine kinase
MLDRSNADNKTRADLAAARYVTFRWAESARPGSVHVFPEGTASAMVNEEDHLRIQVVRPGSCATECVAKAESIAASLGRHVGFARHTRYGYLTASLANAGSGMRLSFLLHLAALAVTPAVNETLGAAQRMGCTVRGAFGEGTPGTGAFVQVSNRYTWGPEAANAMEQTLGAVRYLIDRERQARADLLRNPEGRADVAFAGEGARDSLLESELAPADALRCISTLRLAIAVGVTPGDIVRTGEWVAVAGVIAWAEKQGRGSSFERMRRLAAIRHDLRP